MPKSPWRAIVLGTVLMPINCYWLVISRPPYQYQPIPTIISPFFNVIFILLLLVVANRFLSQLKDSYNAGMGGRKCWAFEGGHRNSCFIHWSKGGLVDNGWWPLEIVTEEGLRVRTSPLAAPGEYSDLCRHTATFRSETTSSPVKPCRLIGPHQGRRC